MEDILLGIFLFAVYFSFVSCFFYSPDSTGEKFQESVEQQENNNPVETSELEATSVESEMGTEVELATVEVGKLTFLQAQKVAKALGIRLSVKGKKRRKQWLLTNIAKRLSEQPHKVSGIAELLAG